MPFVAEAVEAVVYYWVEDNRLCIGHCLKSLDRAFQLLLSYSLSV
jgi:hypothetical protein